MTERRGTAMSESCLLWDDGTHIDHICASKAERLDVYQKKGRYSTCDSHGVTK